MPSGSVIFIVSLYPPSFPDFYQEGQILLKMIPSYLLSWGPHLGPGKKAPVPHHHSQCNHFSLFSAGSSPNLSPSLQALKEREMEHAVCLAQCLAHGGCGESDGNMAVMVMMMMMLVML